MSASDGGASVAGADAVWDALVSAAGGWELSNFLEDFQQELILKIAHVRNISDEVLAKWPGRHSAPDMALIREWCDDEKMIWKSLEIRVNHKFQRTLNRITIPLDLCTGLSY